MRRSTEILLAAVVTGLVAFQVGSCGRDTVAEQRDVAYKLANQYRWQRDSTAKAQAKTDTVVRRVIVADRAVLAQRDSLMSVLTYADEVLADSSASLVTLRVTLAEQVRQTRAYIVRTDSLQVAMRDLVAAQALERLAVNRTLIAADSAVQAWRGVADAERRKGWRRFTQGAFVGGIVSLLLVVAL